MATILDVGLLQKFDFIFPFLFVLVIVWGILSYSKFLGENQFMHSIVALVLALLVLLSEDIRNIINSAAPWFVLFFIAIIFILISVKIFGTTDEQIMGVLKSEQWLVYGIVIAGLLILAFSVADVMFWQKEAAEPGSSGLTGTDTGVETREGFFATLRNPQVLGFMLIFIIAAFTIQKLTKFE